MTYSNTIPHFYIMEEIDVSEIVNNYIIIFLLNYSLKFIKIMKKKSKVRENINKNS